MNLFTAILFTLPACSLQGNELWKLICISQAGIAYFMAATNGIPLKVGGIANDGYNVFSAHTDSVGLSSLYQQLDLNARLSDGVRLKELPFEIIQIPNGSSLSNPLIANSKLFEYYWYAERNEMEEARKILEELNEVKEKMIPLIRNMITVEQVYLELIGENREFVVDELCTGEFLYYLKRAKYDVHANRVKYGLELRKDPVGKQTKKAKERLMKVIQNSPVEGEAQMSLEFALTMEKLLGKENN